VQVNGLSDVKAVASGGAHSLALKNDGTLWAWGYNYFGQLGDNTNTNSNVPVQVSNLSGVQAIAAGSLHHSLALKNDGTLWAWGANGTGQLGDGTNADSNTPVQVDGLSGVQAIAAGDFHSLALKNDGTLWAWGNNDLGQLGDGTNADSNTPVQVNGLSGVQAIAGSWGHSLALKNDGTLWAWGANWIGQLGDGTNSNSNTPVQVSNLSGVQAIAAGGDYSLAIGSFEEKEPYTWSGVLQPINGGTTTDRADDTSVFKLGSTVPVKFKLTGGSAGITDATAKLYFTKIDNGIVGTQLEATPTAAATEGNLFRHDQGSPDTTSDDQYIFNWSTKDLTAGTYKLTVDLGDGTADNAQAINHVLVSLR
jgi:hypothetical protein